MELDTGKFLNVGLLLVAIVVVAKLISAFLILRSQKRLPPVIKAFPLVGGLVHFLKGPIVMMREEYQKLGSVFTVCTYGEKHALKLSEKALRVEMDLKARINKRSRSRVVDSEIRGDSVLFDRQKSSGHESRGPKMSSSSSMKSSLGKPFLKRHFSFGSKGTRSLSDSHTSRKKGVFWAKSSKELEILFGLKRLSFVVMEL